MTSRCVAVGMIGAMGSGKSVIARLLCAENDLVYLSPDVYWDRDEPYTWEKSVDNWAKVIADQYRCVKTGKSFLIDTASRVPIARQEMTRVIKGWSHGTPGHDFKMIGVYVRADLPSCFARNHQRRNPQSDQRVLEYWNALAESPPSVETDGFDEIHVIENKIGTDLSKIRLPKF